MSKSIGKRDAKRRAYFHASLVIEDALAAGWDTLDRYGDDRHLVEAALMDLHQQLFEKSRDPRPQGVDAAEEITPKEDPR